MGAFLELPKEPGELTDAIDSLLAPSVVERNIQLVGWYVNRWWLRGVRNFFAFDYDRGTVEIDYEDADGDLHMRWDGPVTSLTTEVGRLMRLDIRPIAKKQDFALASMRDASMAQVILDNALSDLDGVLKAQFINMMCMDGMVGLAAWEDDQVDSPLAHTKEIIPAWELLSTPHEIQNPTDLRAISRVRVFPLVQLAKMADVNLRGKTDEELEVFEMPYGADLSMGMADSLHGGGSQLQGGNARKFIDRNTSEGQTKRRPRTKPLRDSEKFVRLVETHVLGPRNTLARYIAKAGRVVFIDSDNLTKRRQVPMPIGRAIYDDIGTFYGRSFLSKVIPFSMQLEALMESAMQSAADADRLGITLIPLDWEVQMDQLNNVDGQPRIATYASNEYNKDGLHHVSPTTVNDVAARTIALGFGALDRVTGHSPALSGQNAGRIDSQVGLQELGEQASTGLLPKAAYIEDAIVTVARRVLYNARKKANKSADSFSRGLPLSKITNSIAGIIIDPETGRVRINAEGMPDPYGVNLHIASKDPQRKEQKKSDAVASHNAGFITIDELRIMNAQEDWDLPLGSPGVYDNYVRAVLINLIMFGDGENPGILPGGNEEFGNMGNFFSIDFDKPHIHLMAIEDFTSPHEFHLASDEVVEAFKVRKQEIASRLGFGGSFPQGLETAEQAALSLAQAGQQGGGAGARQAG